MDKKFEDMTEDEKEMIIRASKRAAAEHGAPKDAWVIGYGRVLIDGELTESGKEWVKEIEKSKEGVK